MKTHIIIPLVLCLIALAGCRVTEEKIELWKSTQKGPKKLAGVLIDAEQDMALRAKAVVALTEIKEQALLSEAFGKIDAADGDAVIAAAAPMLAAIADGRPGEEDSLDAAQVAAKDGLFLLYDHAGKKSRQLVADALIKWCTTGNFAARERAGFTIRVIVQKLGAPALQALSNQLTIDQPAIKPIADLLRQSGDEKILAQASAHLAAQLSEHPDRLAESHLMAAAVIGGAPVADTLVRFATDSTLGAELQRYALRTYSVALDEKNIRGTAAQVAQLAAMASNPATDRYHREETWMTLAQVNLPESAAALLPLLRDSESFWRLVGARCLLRLDGKAHVTAVLNQATSGRDEEEVSALVDVVARFPMLKDSLVEIAAAGPSPVARGIALLALPRIGTPADIDTLKKWTGDRQRLPAGFAHRTVGDAAGAAIVALEKRG